jgi:hypothetical protein
MQLRKNQGVALIMALALLVIIAGIALLLSTRSLGEIKHSRDDLGIVQALTLARGGATAGLLTLNQPLALRGSLTSAVNTNSGSNSGDAWSFGGTNANQVPTASAVANALNPVITALQTNANTLFCNTELTPQNNSGKIKIRVFFTDTACDASSPNLPSGVVLPSGRFVEGSPRTAGNIPDNVDLDTPDLVPGAQAYAIPFVLVSTATIGDNLTRNIVVQGEYKFITGSSSFARYALFTNRFVTGGNGRIWFTASGLFDGPVHTNQNYAFQYNPWFGGMVTSAGCTLPTLNGCTNNVTSPGMFFPPGDNTFYASNAFANPSRPSVTSSGVVHAPEFTGGVDWSAPFVKLPANNNRITAGVQQGGLQFTGNLARLELWAADNNGAPLIVKDANGQWTPAASFQYIRACTGTADNTCTTYRYGPDNQLQKFTAPTYWNDIISIPNFTGVINVQGSIDRLSNPFGRTNIADPSTASPAVASFAKLTIANDTGANDGSLTAGNIRITSDLTYEVPPCTGNLARNNDTTVSRATCNKLDVKNILGIYSQRDSVKIGNQNTTSIPTLNAPDNVTIHAVMMSAREGVGVENSSTGVPRGGVKLLGGIIEEFYDAFGTASNGVSTHGYSRQFNYDKRMSLGVAPPFFPSTGQDNVSGVAVVTFGQREQIY